MSSNRSAMNFDFPAATSRSPRSILHQRIHEFNTLRTQRREPLAPGDGLQSPRRAPFHDQTPAPPPTLGRNARSSNRRHRGGPTSDPPTRTSMDQMHHPSAEADSLLEQPIPRIGSPDIASLHTREYLGEAEVNRQRKRRKIDHEARQSGVGMNGFRYGFKGTATPGPLSMEIFSNDGGYIHTEPGRVDQKYGPGNMLRNDKSVYCTNANANRCNIILRHRQEATFTLSKIVIKAPATGFTSPIQEGLIFISMSSDLVPRTAAYRVRDSSPPSKTTTSRDEENQRPPSRRRDSTSRSIPPAISYITRPPVDTSGHSLHDPSAASPTLATTVVTTPPPLVPGFDITIHCDSPSSDEEEPSSAATIADRQRRDNHPPVYIDHSSDSEDMEEGIERLLEARTLGLSPQMLRGEVRMRRRPLRRAEPSRLECRVPVLEPKTQPNSNASREPTTTAEDQHLQQEQRPGQQQQQEERSCQQPPPAPHILPPHARFFMEPEKSVVSVKFEPEVTGKYILLKLWSPARDQNIDIQSIIAYGYAGPRSFPGTTIL